MEPIQSKFCGVNVRKARPYMASRRTTYADSLCNFHCNSFASVRKTSFLVDVVTKMCAGACVCVLLIEAINALAY